MAKLTKKPVYAQFIHLLTVGPHQYENTAQMDPLNIALDQYALSVQVPGGKWIHIPLSNLRYIEMKEG